MSAKTARKRVQLVNAIDIASNAVVQIPESKTVKIEVPESVGNPYGGDGTPVTPDSQRIFRQPAPTRLIRIEPALNDRGRPWPLVVYRHNPNAYWVSATRTRNRVQSECYVRNERDARDPFFSALSVAERAIILSAAIAALGHRAN